MDTIMELDDFKSAWQSLDRRLELDNRLKLHALHERSTHKARRALRPLVWGQIAQILFALPFIALAALLWMSHPVHLATIVAGVLVHAYGVLTITCAGVVLGQLGKVDYGKPVLDIQKQLLRPQPVYPQRHAGRPAMVVLVGSAAASAGRVGACGLAGQSTLAGGQWLRHLASWACWQRAGSTAGHAARNGPNWAARSMTGAVMEGMD